MLLRSISRNIIPQVPQAPFNWFAHDFSYQPFQQHSLLTEAKNEIVCWIQSGHLLCPSAQEAVASHT